MRALGIFLISLFLITTTYANPCPSSKIAAWYVSSAEDINILEKRSFNLFSFNNVNYEKWSTIRRNNEIQKAVNSLAPCSQLILPIDNFSLKTGFLMMEWANS